MAKKHPLELSKSEERKILATQSAKIRKDPSIGIQIAKEAGILDKNGRLTGFYKQKA
jgi:hypothetical protein